MNWDNYFHIMCRAIASKSPCLSRKIGAVLVRDHSVISTGYNGPARRIPHCGYERIKSDHLLLNELENNEIEIEHLTHNTCPRKTLNYMSGEGMEWCTAQHAEENCISNAARNGVSTFDTVLYMNSVIPCKNCFSTLINAGIKGIIVESTDLYDPYSKFIIQNSDILIRTFKLE
jgi:dCMP deaminase